MAGRGPAPKPAAERRRRNKTTTRELDATPPAATDVPELPKKYRVGTVDGPKDIAYLKATRDWYAAWTRSPLAAEFTEVHWLRLQEIARLKDGFERTGDLDLAKELRLQLAGFGGTPIDVRRLGVTIKRPEGDKPAGDGPTAPAKDPKANVRRLRVVDPALVAEG
jgi:hypothetical protein